MHPYISFVLFVQGLYLCKWCRESPTQGFPLRIESLFSWSLTILMYLNTVKLPGFYIFSLEKKEHMIPSGLVFGRL